MIGKSGKTVNAWENNRGQPDAEILIQLCDIYHVDNILKEFSNNNPDLIVLSEHEEKLIIAYRNNEDMQPAVDRLLKIEKVTEIKIAARNGEFKTLEIMDSEKNILLDEISKMPDVEDD